MIKKILVIVVLLLAVLAVVIVRQPSEFGVSRSTTISAPASRIFPHVNNLSLWKAWSPWAKLDPNAKETLEGPAEGTGAILRWAGDKHVGEGSMTITESRENEVIRFRLDFLKPMSATNTAEFVFKPQGEKTEVTWSMSGQKNFVAKAIGLVMNCEKMVGEQFEKGLADLKSLAEKT